MMGSFGLLALAMSVAPVQEVTDLDRFQLFNNCEPMSLLVESLSDSAADIGLTEERLQVAAESRLRGARLYTSDRSQPYLYVNVSVGSTAFHTSLEYTKKMRDRATGYTGSTSAWDRAITGTHGQGANYIVSGLSELLDIFLTEYLRVNESACTESPQPPNQ